MSDPSDPQRKPRLSLQIKAISHGPSVRSSRALAAAIDPKSPTSFNTLSNVYVTAIERSTPEPVTAIKRKPTLRLQTQAAAKPSQLQKPYLGPYLDTPQSAHPASPATALTAIAFPSAMTATPPMSAGPVDSTKAQPVFNFSMRDLPSSALMSPGTPRRRKTFPNSLMKLPYSHPRNLHSILRNSPLPPLSTRSPDSPRRSQRLQEKAARRVAYNSPLEQEITTQLYVKSHVDLLSEDVSPFSPYNIAEDPENVLDQTMAYTPGETRDGGHTPGPFEEMRRRMAGLQTSSPVSPPTGGIQKRSRKKKEKKRQWVWTLGADPDDADSGSPLVAPTFDKAAETPVPKLSVTVKAATTGGTTVPIIAMPAPRPKSRNDSAGKTVSIAVPAATAQTGGVVEVPALVHETLSARTPPSSVEPPTPSVESVMSHNSSTFDSRADVEMSDTSSVFTDADDQAMLDMEMEVDMDTDTPTATRSNAPLLRSKRLGSLTPSADGDAGQRRDTPIPDYMIQA